MNRSPLVPSLLIAASLLSSMALPVRSRAADSAAPLKLKVGDTAPDFTLTTQQGKKISLHDFHGKKTVILAFYVFAFTGG